MKPQTKDKLLKWTWRIFVILIAIALNCVNIFFVVQKCIGKNIQLSSGETMEVELIAWWKWIKVWRWYYTLMLYGGMIGGALLTIWWLQFCYKQAQHKKDVRREEKREEDRQSKEDERERKRQEAEDKRMREFNKAIEKAIKGVR